MSRVAKFRLCLGMLRTGFSDDVALKSTDTHVTTSAVRSQHDIRCFRGRDSIAIRNKTRMTRVNFQLMNQVNGCTTENCFLFAWPSSSRLFLCARRFTVPARNSNSAI